MWFRHDPAGYHILSRLGGGRYGVCYLAENTEGQQFVLKRFRPRQHKKYPDDHRHEAVILSGLSHPAVPALCGIINSPSGYFFVLEYKKGKTLKHWLFRDHKVFSDSEIFRIGSQLFDILIYIHSRSVVHRDISIANITDDGEHISLLDFGLARYTDPEGGFLPSLDFPYVGNVLLYLLCSGYKGDRKKPWHEVLPLTSAQKHCLLRMVELEEPFHDTKEAAEAFHSSFFPHGGNFSKEHFLF